MTPSCERENLQVKWEDANFSPEHFLADWAEEDELIIPILDTPMPWKSAEEKSTYIIKVNRTIFNSDNLAFTADEQERLLRLPNIDILQLNSIEQKSALLGLAELIFCWVHEQISTLGEHFSKKKKKNLT